MKRQSSFRRSWRSRNAGFFGIRPGVWLSIITLVLIVIGAVLFSHRSTPQATPLSVGNDLEGGAIPQAGNTDPGTMVGSREEPSPAVESPDRTGLLGNPRGVTFRFGGTEMVFPEGWTRLDQPETFFVQQRAIRGESEVAVSAGAFKIDLPVKYYVSLGIAGIISGPEKQLERLANLAGISVDEVEKLLESQIGRQTMVKLKSSFPSMHFDLVDTRSLTLSHTHAFEVRSKMTDLPTGRVLYSREFIYPGNAAQEIVQITYASPSEGIFQDNSLIDLIRTPTNSAPTLGENPRSIMEEDGRFSYQVPSDWIRIPNKNRGKSPKTQFDRVKGPNVVGYPAGMITPLGWETDRLEAAVQAALEMLRKEQGRRTNPRITAFTTTQGVTGKRLHPAHDMGENQFITLYAFKLDDNRVVTFICWPSRGDLKDLLSLYDTIMSSVTMNPKP